MDYYRHTFTRSRIAGTVTCIACNLLPLDAEDVDTACHPPTIIAAAASWADDVDGRHRNRVLYDAGIGWDTGAAADEYVRHVAGSVAEWARDYAADLSDTEADPDVVADAGAHLYRDILADYPECNGTYALFETYTALALWRDNDAADAAAAVAAAAVRAGDDYGADMTDMTRAAVDTVGGRIIGSLLSDLSDALSDALSAADDAAYADAAAAGLFDTDPE